MRTGTAPKPQREETPALRPAYSVRAVSRALDLLDFLGRQPTGASLPEIAAAIALPKSTAFRYLATLVERGYVVRDEARGDYRLGGRFLGRLPVEILREHAAPSLSALRDRFQETINLGLFDTTRVLYVDIFESPRPMRFATRVGDRDLIHATALGKAIAAQLPTEQVVRILDAEGMPKLTERTIREPARFLRELEHVRRRGWALDNGENAQGGRCVAVPLVAPGVVAAISLSAPANRFRLKSVDEVGAALLGVARRLEAELGEASHPAVP